MTPTTAVRHRLTRADFAADRHAARYLGQFDEHPEAMERLLDLLNDPDNVRSLQDAERRHGVPALSGIVTQIEDDPTIHAVLASGQQGHRFRQTVGVAVKLQMGLLGWQSTGRKGTVRRARYFTKAEHFEGPAQPPTDPRARGLAALDAVEAIGDERERSATGRELLDALAESRAAEGRVF